MIRTTNIDALPFGTPVFAKCKYCGVILTHPPIQVPRAVKPGQPGRYEIEWDNCCLDCAPGIIVGTKVADITPARCWSSTLVKVIDNPILKT